ncbi:MAG TPA: VOC family protein [Gemmatimonadaceae bacterium]|nr:VOC family protein [Gemmatimonadaceae bacterium]
MTQTEHAPRDYGIAPSGFRLPDATHLGRVRLQVADLDRSIAYYETVIGLRVVDRAGDVATLGPHGADAVLVELRAKAGVRAVARRGHIGLYHFAILLPDRASLGRLIAHLAAIDVHAGMSDHFVSEAIYLQDPDGLGIEVYADRPRSEWRSADRQLAMTTNPLDAHDVVRAGGGVPWTGAPAGTVIGHVHLYVRDLDEASAFYHEALGLDKVVWGYPGALFMSAGGYHHHLGTNTWAAGAPLPTDDDARLVEWEIVVPDAASVARAAESLENHGADVRREKGDVVAHDPWGTQLRIVAASA